MENDDIIQGNILGLDEGDKMGLIVRELLKWENLQPVKLVAGEEGLDNEIKGATIIEAPDIVKFINGGEILLTGLYAFRYDSLDDVERRIGELERKKISALIFKRGRDVEFAEEKIGLFQKYAEKCGIPMLEVTFDVSFKDIMRLIMEELFSEEVKRLKYFKTTRDNFEALILSLSSHEDGIEKFLHVLGKLLGNPAAVYEQNGGCLGRTKKSPEKYSVIGGTHEFEPEAASNYRYMKRQIYLEDEDRKVDQYLVTMKKIWGTKLYLVVTEMGSKLDVMDYIAIEGAISALQYEISRWYAVSELEKKYQNDILHGILSGEACSVEELKRSTRLLGMSVDKVYQVIVFGLEYNEKKSPEDINIRMDDVNVLREIVKKCFPDAIIQNDLDKVVVVREEWDEQRERCFRNLLQEDMKRIQSLIKDAKKSFRVKAGIGKKTEGIINLKNSYREANDALEFLDIAGDIFGEGSSKALYFSDMGILKLLAQLKTEEELWEYIPESLQKLFTYRKGQRNELPMTLRLYLDNNQNLVKTAQNLHVHYKTVAYRMEKIADITGMDYGDAGEMLAVRIGLIVYQILEKVKEKQNKDGFIQ